MKIKILSDSTCDLPQALIQMHNITVIPLIVMKDGQEFWDGQTITPTDIFSHVAAGGTLCTTAARSVGIYLDVFEKYVGKYDGVIHISLGSGFSSSYQNACLAAEEFDNVQVVDSKNLSVGQGLTVLEACRLAQTAQSLNEVVQALEDFTGRVEASFVVDKLDYLVKGGRCSSAAALGANLLNLKPCIEVKDGRMSVVKKYRGSFAKCLSAYVRERLEGREDLDRDSLFVVRTQMEEDAFQTVLETANSCGNFENIYTAAAGCTISCHCGPGTLGVLFVRK